MSLRPDRSIVHPAVLLATLLVALVLSSGELRAAKPPNFVVIFTDDQNCS